MDVILSTAFLGPVSYYCKLMACSNVFMEQHEHYIKQTYRNRCVVAAPDGPQVLTVPIVRQDPSHAEIRDIQISNHGNWRHLHCQALLTAYDNSPYFEYYVDDIFPIYNKEWKFLLDFNEALRIKICELLDIEPCVHLTEHYFQTEKIVDYRQIISPKSTESDKLFKPVRYHQVFEDKQGFLPDLSIVDLLFNMGPESVFVLRDSMVKPD